MIARALVLSAIAAGILAAGAGDGRAAVSVPEPHCSPAPDSCAGWFRGAVTVTWTYDTAGVTQTNCNVVSVTSDTAGVPVSCAVEYGASGWVSRTITIRVDATAPVVSVRPSRPADESGWYNHAVAVEATGTDATSGIASCSSPTYGGPDAAAVSVSAGCADVAGNVSSQSVSFRYDATGPAVSARPARAPDAADWYHAPLEVAFVGTDAVSGVAACTTASYAGPDASEASVPGTCSDQAGNRAGASFELRYDATAPVVTLAADRAPDGGGLYARPLTVSANGTDALSGLDGCDRPLTYRGPDRERVVYSATCRDRAGNVAGRKSFTFGYDTTRPVIASVEAKGARGGVTLAWSVSGATVIEVTRSPGLGRSTRTIVYRGEAGGFTDAKVVKGRRYRYLVRARDAAGNVTTRALSATPVAGIVSPRPGAVVTSRPLVAWAPIAKATFYNVQVYRGPRKVLTTWVARPRYRLPASWTFDGRPQRLVGGRYRVLVWAAFGTREHPRFGARPASSTFRVGVASRA